MSSHPNPTKTPPAPAPGADAAERREEADRDRRAVRTVDLTDEDIAAIEAAEIAPGFEHLNAEVDDV